MGFVVGALLICGICNADLRVVVVLAWYLNEHVLKFSLADNSSTDLT